MFNLFVYAFALLILPITYAGKIHIHSKYFNASYGATTESAVFKGRITENGKPVDATLSLDLMYESHGHLIPLSLVQITTPSEYELNVNGLAFLDTHLTTSAMLRVQSLSVYGGSTTFEFKMEDDKVEYVHDIDLTSPHKHKKHHHDEDDDDDDEEERPRHHHKKHHKRRSHKRHEEESDDDE